MQKKNSKLETFLYRTLPDQKYERIRGYESCIVVSEKEYKLFPLKLTCTSKSELKLTCTSKSELKLTCTSKSFKYVVLGDEWIYLTENPPKKIKKKVCLGEVISVELVGHM